MCHSYSLISFSVDTKIPEFQCSGVSRETCPHLIARYENAKLDVNNETNELPLIENDQQPMCKYVLIELIKVHDVEAVSKALNFSCIFAVPFNACSDKILERERESKRIAKMRIRCFENLTGGNRRNNIHRWCLPELYLNSRLVFEMLPMLQYIIYNDLIS